METVSDRTAEDKRVRVARQVPKPLDSVWAALMEPEGAEALLGPGARLGSKGEDWRSEDGTYGVTRSFHPREQIRFSWHASQGAPRTLVDLQLHEHDGATEVEIVHSSLTSDLDADAVESRWHAAIDRLEARS